MPSRPFPPPPPHHRRRSSPLVIAVAVSASSAALLALLVLLVLFYLFRFFRRSPTIPVDPAARLRRFPHRALRRATAGFDPARALGRGASASVFRGVLSDGKSVAVKRLDPPSPSSFPNAADREFHNELQVLASIPSSPFVVSLLGYCLEGKKRRLLLYEYMPNGSLQEALFGSSSPRSDLSWDRRFGIILDVAQGLAFLHLQCDPPVIHGDIKPSNVLLDSDFRAKISDFGLARIKTEADLGPELFSQELGPSQELWKSQELPPESPQVGFAFAPRAPSSNSYKYLDTINTLNLNGSPKGKEAALSPSYPDEIYSVEHSKELSGNSALDDGRAEENGQWGKDWWWKQEGSGELSSKDYVREWIGSQIGPSNNPDWDEERRSSPEPRSRAERSNGGHNTPCGELGFDASEKNPDERRAKGGDVSDRKKRKMREWWKEEYFAEISKKGQPPSRKGLRCFRTASGRGVESSSGACHDATGRPRDFNVDISFRKGWKKKRSRSVGSDMFGGGGGGGGDLFSRELSSTTSMRGTICYAAPEYGGDEKADIYSFGVLILVIIAGRRPLHVLSSPMKFEKANLISWCRQLAQAGNLLDLVDERLQGSYSKEQAGLCLNLALLCLQRLPEFRPDSGDIVKILRGEMELPPVPYDLSPSPRARLSSRSRRKATHDADG